MRRGDLHPYDEWDLLQRLEEEHDARLDDLVRRDREIEQAARDLSAVEWAGKP